MSYLYYDNDWRVTLSNEGEGYDNLGSHHGAFTGNGKIGMYVSMSNISTSRTLISGNVQFNQIGKYKNNTIDGFHINDVQVISNTDSNISYTLIHQSLRMDTASVESKFSVASNNIVMMDVVSTVQPLRQYPYCVLQTLQVTPTSNYTASTLDVFHAVRASDGVQATAYNNNIIYNESVNPNQGIYILTSEGTIKTVDCNIATATAYMFESSNVYNVGYNIFTDKSSAYQKFRFTNVNTEETYTFHALGSMMTTYDFPDINEEVKRILLNIMFKQPTLPSLISTIATDNKAMWDRMWTSDIEIVPKTVINEAEAYDVQRHKMFIRKCLFNMYACLRESVNTEINPLNLSYIDTNGNVFFDGDLWLIPTLIFIKPYIAKTLIEYKYKIMEQTTQLASSFGYTGSKYPYKNDVVGYKNVYWDVISPLHIFNNANIVVNIWNYYRVTLDLEWLRAKGYVMMKSIVDFLVSYLKYDGTTYNVPNTLGLGEIICDNHAFTISMIIMALKYITETCYVLGYIPNVEWNTILRKLKIPIETAGSNMDVIRYYDAYAREREIDILDNFIILMPYYSKFYFNDYSSRNNSAIQRNINYYATVLSEKYSTHVLNNLIFTAIYGVLAQTNPSKIVDFMTYFTKVMQENQCGYWGVMNLQNDPSQGNDISLNAFVILIMLTCICGLDIRGSTAPSNVFLETYGIKDYMGTFMPRTWGYVNIGSVGKEERYINVTNQLAYL